MGKTLYGKFGSERTPEKPEQRDHECIAITVTYRESASGHPGSVMDAYIEDAMGEPPDYCGSGFGKRDMGWVFPKEDINQVNVLVKKVRAIPVSGIDVEINLTDADGNPN
jgi:hypothetical protein